MEILEQHSTKPIWDTISKNKKNNSLFKNKLVKKLASLFHIGDFFFTVSDFKTNKTEYLSPCVAQILGYETTSLNIKSLCHADDLIFYIECQSSIKEFYANLSPEKKSKYKATYDFRIKKSNGRYIRLLAQIVPFQSNTNENTTKTITTYTDISLLKTSNTPTLSYIGLDGEPSYIDIPLSKNSTNKPEAELSKREKEILHKIIDGYTSNQIAESLFLSPLTVNTHRKNITKKTACHCTADLIKKATEMGWHK